MHAVLIENNGWYAAQCLEIDIASQGNVREEALQNLEEALTLHFQVPVNSSLLCAAFDTDEAHKLFSEDSAEILSFQFDVEEANNKANKPKSKLLDATLSNTDTEGNTFRKIRFKLESYGFTEVRQLNNHAKFVRRENSEIKTAILPHYLQICPLVLRSVLIQAGLSKVEFDKL